MSTVSLMRQFYLSLFFVAVCQVSPTSPMNKTTVDGNVIISGDHNEVILSSSQETKKALAAIKSELYSLNERDTKFAQHIFSLKEHMGIKLDLMNKSNTALSVQVQAIAQRLPTLEKQGTHSILESYFDKLTALLRLL